MMRNQVPLPVHFSLELPNPILLSFSQFGTSHRTRSVLMLFLFSIYYWM